MKHLLCKWKSVKISFQIPGKSKNQWQETVDPKRVAVHGCLSHLIMLIAQTHTSM